MNIEDMTPEQLREYAAMKEARTQQLRADYLQEQSVMPALVEQDPTPYLQPYEKLVTIDDLTVKVDMRRAKSRRAVILLNAYNNSITTDKDGNRRAALTETLDLIGYLLAGEVDDAVEAYVVKKYGYDDAEKIYEIEGRIMEQIDLKN